MKAPPKKYIAIIPIGSDLHGKVFKELTKAEKFAKKGNYEVYEIVPVKNTSIKTTKK